jgi:hypothetical protein
MSLSLKRIFTVLAAISLIYVPGCQEEYAGIERAEDASVYRLAASDSELTLSLGECGDAVDAEAGENEAAPCFWTKAVVTIGGVPVIDWVFVCGNSVLVRVPNDPALLGLPITVELPDGRTACGKVGR